MISEECRKAGNLLAEKGRTPYTVSTAKAYHAQCPGGTWCDCACRTDVVVKKT